MVSLGREQRRPKPLDSTAKIAAYYANHEVRSMIATLLIDGVAGVAVLALAYGLWRYLAGHQNNLRQAVLWAGIGAGLASLGQMSVGELMSYRAAHASTPDHVKTLFTVLNDGDTVKIAPLAIMIGAASVLARRGGEFPRWLTGGGLIFAPLLAISGLAFPLGSDALYASLALTLLGLLVRVVAATVTIARRTAFRAPSLVATTPSPRAT